MEELHTIYPYGLNNRHGNNQDQRNEEMSVRTMFHRKAKKRKKRSRRSPHIPTKTAEHIYDLITGTFQKKNTPDHYPEQLNSAIITAQKIIPQMNKVELKKIGGMAHEDTIKECNIPLRLLHIIIDLTAAKLQVKTDEKPQASKKKIEHAFTIKYVNHWIDKLRLGNILHDPALVETLSICVKDKGLPTVVYKYQHTVRGQLFNYKETVGNFKHDEDLSKMDCACSDSEFKDIDHGHIVTGNLHIINNKRLRGLFRKGPNYREKETLNWKKAFDSLKEDINSFIEKWSSKICKPKEYFYEWKIKLLELIQTRGKSLKKKIKCRPVKKVLKDPDCLKELKKLKEQFVLVPIDKAANNIGFICKKYFLEVLLQETKSNTYVLHQDSAESIINAVAKKCLDIGIPVKGDNKTLPQIHATIKMHKNPVKFRFIIGARNCVTKQVAKKLVKILQLIMKIHRRYCNKIKFYTGIERFWIIENNAQILEDIKFINSKRNARNIKTFDFSTLYTKIPLDDLKEKLKEIVDKAFKGGHNKYIQITNKTARWFHSKKNESFTKEDIFSMIDLVIDNSFFTFGDKVFRQSIGIPMGIDPAPQMANLYLYYYEAKFMEMLTKENYSAAKKFNYTRRFIDDLHTLNNDGHLEENNNMGRIYPQELKLNQENKNDDKATFLDLEEQIKDACIEVKTYDKRDAFKFEIINYPDLSGNIPTKPAYGVFTSQVIRYARICSKKADLLERVKSLTKKLLRKHYTINGLKSSLKKCLKKHRWITTKLGPRLHQNLTEE